MIGLAVWTAVASAAPTTYSLKPADSALFVVVFNDQTTVASGLGHDHAISPRTFDGSVTWDPEDLSACKVQISFPVSELFPDLPGFRELAGLDPDGAVNDNQKEQIKKNFLKSSQLNGPKFPTIRYASTHCAPSKQAGRVNVTGQLTIRGTALTVTVPMKIQASGASFAAQGSFEALHSDFGFKPFTNLLGALRNEDRMKFVIDVKGSAG
ncbi:MAG: YceI family protein [Myxococcota bacterium]